MRVLQVLQPVDAGVPRLALQQVADQVERGWEVTVACPPDDGVRAETEAAGARWVRWDARREPGPSTVGETRRLARIVRAVDPGVVHLHSAKAGLAGRLHVRGRRATVFQPSAWSFLAVSGAVRAAAVAWERWAARWADAIVCVSDAERRRGEHAGIRGARYVVVHNGVDLEAYAEAGPEEQQAARRSLGVVPEGPMVVCVGRLSEQKGQDLLLDAWHEVASTVPRATLALVGDGPDRAALESRAASNVVFAGRRDDVPLWMAAADVVALPSRWEGMSFVVLEAMARGRSIVATAVDGVEESLGTEGTAGKIVPIGDADALAVALTERLGTPDLAREEGHQARLRAERHFSVERATSAVAALYEQILDERRVTGSRGRTPRAAGTGAPPGA